MLVDERAFTSDTVAVRSKVRDLVLDTATCVDSFVLIHSDFHNDEASSTHNSRSTVNLRIALPTQRAATSSNNLHNIGRRGIQKRLSAGTLADVEVGCGAKSLNELFATA